MVMKSASTDQCVSKVFVGTSGWSYSWNPDGFKWYARYSGLNAVELNASFYRLPYKSMAIGWARVGKSIRWSIKVHRMVTHVCRLKQPRALEWFNYLLERVSPLEENGLVDFYLFQLPPSYRAGRENWERIEAMASKTELGPRMAIEWRHESWFKHEWIDRVRELGITIVSIDSPDYIFYASTSPYVYVRMHGRSGWYTHYYTDEELEQVAEWITRLSFNRVYVFFNNNHDMLENARRMYKLLTSVIK